MSTRIISYRTRRIARIVQLILAPDNVEFNFSIIVNLELITARARQKNAVRYKRAGAKNSGEDRIPVEQVFRRRPAPRSLSLRAHICAALSSDHTGYLPMHITLARSLARADFPSTGNIARLLYSLREIFYTCSRRISDFLQLCIKRAVAPPNSRPRFFVHDSRFRSECRGYAGARG